MKNNKLIAEFMGLPTEVFKPSRITNYYHREYNSGTWYEEHELSYEVSWDWLMPVINKIESDERYDVEILQYGTRILDNQKEIVNNIANISFDKKIDHTYQAVVEFIKNQKNN